MPMRGSRGRGTSRHPRDPAVSVTARHHPVAEIVRAGEDTRLDFQADLRVIEAAAREHGELVQQVRTWENHNTIDLAHRVRRMRESDHWRGPGMKGNDREFYGWL